MTASKRRNHSGDNHAAIWSIARLRRWRSGCRGVCEILLDPEHPSPFNPLAGNPLRSRADVAAALSALYRPIEPSMSLEGGSGLIDCTGAVFDGAAARLEGFARPLWGLAAAAAGGVDHAACWQVLRSRLSNGLDPGHAEYWGEAGRYDQRIVELAALSFALCVAPEHLWHPLDRQTRQRLANYLERAAGQATYPNNWKFFPVLIDLGLRAIGARGGADRFSEIDSYYLGDGWYRDGVHGQLDHYIGFAFHFYGLLYAALAPGDAARAGQFRDRARAFAAQFVHWFAGDGAALPFGRSLTYRFACAGFLGACAFAGLEALPWGVMKGLYLRHLRWWRQWPITRRDGILTIGYGYPNQLIAENYNSAASPYWAFKAFLPLALPDDHPFWTADERDLPARSDPAVILPKPGMMLAHEPGQTIALVAGQADATIASGAEKYAKFAYSTRYAFSVESDPRRFDRCAFDSMIGLANDDGSWRVRESCEYAAIRGDIIVARWRPWRDVTVETWLYWDRPWHIRVHRIRSGRVLKSVEGGFSIPRPDGGGPFGSAGPGAARCETREDFSGIVDLASPESRQGRVHLAEPNTNLLHPRTIVPQLTGAIAAGETIIACAVIASPDLALCHEAWAARPAAIRPLPQP